MSPQRSSRQYRPLPIPRRPPGLPWPSGETAIGEQVAVTLTKAGELAGVAPGTIRSRIDRGALPAFRLGRRIVVRIQDLAKDPMRRSSATRQRRKSKFKTRDVQMAVWLKALGYQLLRIQGKRTRTFMFEPVRTRDINAFYKPQRRVSAERLFGLYDDLASCLPGRTEQAAIAPAIAA